jgi:hypothetical protein
MQRDFTRQELYDLVWLEPMQKLAKRFEMSDTGLAKICRSADIPRPPRGFWAKLAAGKKVVRIDLPNRGPGMSGTVEIGRSSYFWDIDREKVLNEELSLLPTFDENLEDVSAEAKKAVGKVPVPRSLDKPHKAVTALLKRDEERRQKVAESSYTFHWNKPVFDSVFEKRRLRILNALFMAAAKHGYKSSVSGKAAGGLSISIGDTGVSFLLEQIKPRKQQGRWHEEREPVGGKGGPMELVIGDWLMDEGTRLSWCDEEGCKLEGDLTEILVSLIVIAEMKYRNGRLANHARRVEQKARIEEEERERILEEERMERERQQRLAQARIDKLVGEANDLMRAETIRTYVARVKERALKGDSDAPDGEFKVWEEWALGEADRIDPVLSGRFLQPVEEDLEEG